MLQRLRDLKELKIKSSIRYGVEFHLNDDEAWMNGKGEGLMMGMKYWGSDIQMQAMKRQYFYRLMNLLTGTACVEQNIKIEYGIEGEEGL